MPSPLEQLAELHKAGYRLERSAIGYYVRSTRGEFHLWLGKTAPAVIDTAHALVFRNDAQV